MESRRLLGNISFIISGVEQTWILIRTHFEIVYKELQSGNQILVEGREGVLNDCV